MTTKPLPTPEEAARAAEIVLDWHPGFTEGTQARADYDRAIALLKAYAAGELVRREDRCEHLSTYTTDDGCGFHLVLCQACGATL